MKYVPLIGRILYSMIFIVSGFNHIFNLSQMSQYTASLGVPAPTLMTIVTGLLILAGGASILLGFKPKIGAVLLAVFLIPVTFVAHAFWKIQQPMQAQIQMAMFMKNLSLLGAAFAFYYFGTGPLSLDKQEQ